MNNEFDDNVDWDEDGKLDDDWGDFDEFELTESSETFVTELLEVLPGLNRSDLDEFDIDELLQSVSEINDELDDNLISLQCWCKDAYSHQYKHLPYISCDKFQIYLQNNDLTKLNHCIFNEIKKYTITRNNLLPNVVNYFACDALDVLLHLLNIQTWIKSVALCQQNDTEFMQGFNEQIQTLQRFTDELKAKIKLIDFTSDLKALSKKNRQEIIGYTRTAKKYAQNLCEYFRIL
eukprot:198214_1